MTDDTPILPGHEFIDNARCWGCMGALYVNTKSTSEAFERLAVRRSSGEVVTVEGVDAERARAIAEFVKVLDRRAKGRGRRAAKPASRPPQGRPRRTSPATL